MGETGGPVVVVLNRDLMFGSRITGVLRHLGYRARFARETDDFLAALAAEGEGAALGIIDMNAGVDWDAVGAFLGRSGERAPLLGFGPHVDVAGRKAAKEAGLDRIVSNGQFHADAPTLIARYARTAPPTPAAAE